MFDANIDKFDVIPIWIWLLGLPWELWNWNSFRDIRHALGAFIDANMTFAQTGIMYVERILVSLNIKIDIREELNFI